MGSGDLGGLSLMESFRERKRISQILEEKSRIAVSCELREVDYAA